MAPPDLIGEPEAKSSRVPTPGLSRVPPTAAHEESVEKPGFREEALPRMGPVYLFALRLTCDEDRAADLTQETFLHAYRRWHEYSRDTHCRSWLFTICRDLFLRRQERRSRHRRIPQEDRGPGEAFLDSPITPTPLTAPEQAFLMAHMDDVVGSALNDLPREYREAVALVDIQGVSFTEAGEILGVTDETVRSRTYRGRNLLRSELARVAQEEVRIPRRGQGC